jgi:uncharacterized protein (DUF4415 family)
MSKKSTLQTSDSDAPITQSDIDAGTLVLVKRIGARVVQPKKRVTLYLDASVVDRFKEQAGERGYQTLITETLKSSFEHADIEATLRKVIREELQTKAA